MTKLTIFQAWRADGTTWRLTYGNGEHKVVFVKKLSNGGTEAVATKTVREMLDCLRAEHARTGERESLLAARALMRADRKRRPLRRIGEILGRRYGLIDLLPEYEMEGLK